MFDKKSKMVFKPVASRKNIRAALSQMRRSGPYCAVCSKRFKNSIMFEEHLQTREHKLLDSPLEVILERIGESENTECPREYQNLRQQITSQETDHPRIGSEGLDISGLVIGSNCVSSVEVFFCEVCNTFVPEDGRPDALMRHCATSGHLKSASPS